MAREFTINVNNDSYDYRSAVLADAIEYLEDNWTSQFSRLYRECMDEHEIVDDDGEKTGTEEGLNAFAEIVCDELWTADSVTGNASGSYWFCTWNAELALCHNQELIDEYINEMGHYEEGDPEKLDVCLRCYMLKNLANEIVDTFLKKTEDDDE